MEEIENDVDFDNQTLTFIDARNPEKLLLAKASHDRLQQVEINPDPQEQFPVSLGQKGNVWGGSETVLITNTLEDWSNQVVNNDGNKDMMKTVKRKKARSDDPREEYVRRAEEASKPPPKRSTLPKKWRNLKLDPHDRSLIALAADPRYEPPANRKLLIRDLSRRAMIHPIPVFCDIDDDPRILPPPPRIEYISRNVRNLSRDFDGSPMTYRCSCKDGCKEDECMCLGLNQVMNEENGPFLKDGKIFIKKPSTDLYSYALFACGDLCGCPPSCPNRIENVLKRNRFEVYRRNSTVGFGVRTLTSLSYGEMVVEFTGEVKDVDNGVNMEYSLELGSPEGIELLIDRIKSAFRCLNWNKTDLRAAEPTRPVFIDPFKKGNEARFMSHGCFPNLQVIRVISNNISTECHRLVFFANRDITAGSELSFNYGIDYVCRANMDCQCGTLLCKNNLNSWRLIGNLQLRKFRLVEIVKMVHLLWKKVARKTDNLYKNIYRSLMESDGLFPALEYEYAEEVETVFDEEEFRSQENPMDSCKKKRRPSKRGRQDENSAKKPPSISSKLEALRINTHFDLNAEEASEFSTSLSPLSPLFRRVKEEPMEEGYGTEAPPAKMKSLPPPRVPPMPPQPPKPVVTRRLSNSIVRVKEEPMAEENGASVSNHQKSSHTFFAGEFLKNEWIPLVAANEDVYNEGSVRLAAAASESLNAFSPSVPSPTPTSSVETIRRILSDSGNSGTLLGMGRPRKNTVDEEMGDEREDPNYEPQDSGALHGAGTHSPRSSLLALHDSDESDDLEEDQIAVKEEAQDMSPREEETLAVEHQQLCHLNDSAHRQATFNEETQEIPPREPVVFEDTATHESNYSALDQGQIDVNKEIKEEPPEETPVSEVASFHQSVDPTLHQHHPAVNEETQEVSTCSVHFPLRQSNDAALAQLHPAIEEVTQKVPPRETPVFEGSVLHHSVDSSLDQRDLPRSFTPDSVNQVPSGETPVSEDQLLRRLDISTPDQPHPAVQNVTENELSEEQSLHEAADSSLDQLHIVIDEELQEMSPREIPVSEGPEFHKSDDSTLDRLRPAVQNVAQDEPPREPLVSEEPTLLASDDSNLDQRDFAVNKETQETRPQEAPVVPSEDPQLRQSVNSAQHQPDVVIKEEVLSDSDGDLPTPPHSSFYFRSPTPDPEAPVAPNPAFHAPDDSARDHLHPAVEEGNLADAPSDEAEAEQARLRLLDEIDRRLDEEVHQKIFGKDRDRQQKEGNRVCEDEGNIRRKDESSNKLDDRKSREKDGKKRDRQEGRDCGRERVKNRERDREEKRDQETGRERDKDRVREDPERGKEREKIRDREHIRDGGREQEKERDKEREKNRDRVRDGDRDQEKNNDRASDRGRDREPDKERELRDRREEDRSRKRPLREDSPRRDTNKREKNERTHNSRNRSPDRRRHDEDRRPERYSNDFRPKTAYELRRERRERQERDESRDRSRRRNSRDRDERRREDSRRRDESRNAPADCDRRGRRSPDNIREERTSRRQRSRDRSDRQKRDRSRSRDRSNRNNDRKDRDSKKDSKKEDSSDRRDPKSRKEEEKNMNQKTSSNKNPQNAVDSPNNGNLTGINQELEDDHRRRRHREELLRAQEEEVQRQVDVLESGSEDSDIVFLKYVAPSGDSRVNRVHLENYEVSSPDVQEWAPRSPTVARFEERDYGVYSEDRYGRRSTRHEQQRDRRHVLDGYGDYIPREQPETPEYPDYDPLGMGRSPGHVLHQHRNPMVPERHRQEDRGGRQEDVIWRREEDDQIKYPDYDPLGMGRSPGHVLHEYRNPMVPERHRQEDRGGRQEDVIWRREEDDQIKYPEYDLLGMGRSPPEPRIQRVSRRQQLHQEFQHAPPTHPYFRRPEDSDDVIQEQMAARRFDARDRSPSPCGSYGTGLGRQDRDRSRSPFRPSTSHFPPEDNERINRELQREIDRLRRRSMHPSEEWRHNAN